MSYVRHKIIKGHRYYYLVYGERQNGKVKQRHVRYLGKYPWRYVTPIRFTRATRKGYAKVQAETWYRRRLKTVTCGTVSESNKTPNVFAMAHELGHVLETTVAQSESKAAFSDMREELKRVTEQVNNSQRGIRAYKRPPLSEQFANLVEPLKFTEVLGVRPS